MSYTMDTRSLLVDYAKRIEGEVLTAGRVPLWDRGVLLATQALARAIVDEGEPSADAIEQSLANASPATDDAATRAGFLSAEGRILGFLHGGDAACRALFQLTPMEP